MRNLLRWCSYSIYVSTLFDRHVGPWLTAHQKANHIKEVEPRPRYGNLASRPMSRHIPTYLYLCFTAILGGLVHCWIFLIPIPNAGVPLRSSFHWPPSSSLTHFEFTALMNFHCFQIRGRCEMLDLERDVTTSFPYSVVKSGFLLLSE